MEQTAAPSIPPAPTGSAPSSTGEPALPAAAAPDEKDSRWRSVSPDEFILVMNTAKGLKTYVLPHKRGWALIDGKGNVYGVWLVDHKNMINKQIMLRTG